jgi:hypothetical protein
MIRSSLLVVVVTLDRRKARKVPGKFFTKEIIAKLPIMSFPRRFWAGIQFVTTLNHGYPIRELGYDKTF